MVGIGQIANGHSRTLDAKRAIREGLPLFAVSLRDQWKVAQPELHLVPNWLRLRVAAAIKAGSLPKSRHGMHSGYCVMRHALDHLGDGWADHFGRLVRTDGIQELISEPYQLTGTACRELDTFCSCLGLRYRVEPRSWWYPGMTLRIVIWEEAAR